MLSLPTEILIEIVLGLDAGADIKAIVATNRKLAMLAANRVVLAHMDKHTNHLATLFKLYPDRLIVYHRELWENKHITSEIKREIVKVNPNIVYVSDKAGGCVDSVSDAVNFTTDLSDNSVAKIKQALDSWMFITEKDKLKSILLYSRYTLQDAVAAGYFKKYSYIICQNESIPVGEFIANQHLFDAGAFGRFISLKRDVTFDIVKRNPNVKWDLRSLAMNANIIISEMLSIGTSGWTLSDYAKNPHLGWRDIVNNKIAWNWRHIAKYI